MIARTFEQAKAYAMQRLEQLSPDLLYHGIQHTLEDVVPAAQRLARLEKVEGEALYLLRTAAWFHDIGYSEQAVFHEMIGGRIARQVLPGFGYTPGQVETVVWAIQATALPQNPQNLIEAILADADLDVLGREDFWPRNLLLRRELALLGKEFSDRDWFTRQLKFVEGHSYFTASARKLRDPGKARSVALLKRVLEALDDQPR